MVLQNPTEPLAGAPSPACQPSTLLLNINVRAFITSWLPMLISVASGAILGDTTAQSSVDTSARTTHNPLCSLLYVLDRYVHTTRDPRANCMPFSNTFTFDYVCDAVVGDCETDRPWKLKSYKQCYQFWMHLNLFVYNFYHETEDRAKRYIQSPMEDLVATSETDKDGFDRQARLYKAYAQLKVQCNNVSLHSLYRTRNHTLTYSLSLVLVMMRSKGIQDLKIYFSC